jgi:adenosylcobinamide kinase/adenosylcobinamide-phosphate guanylyltransferase
MKVLYYGGQKSGKSLLAERKTLELAKMKKPFYIATYNNAYDDSEMHSRIEKHKEQRQALFLTIEESFNLPKVINNNETYLIDCISMWLLNNLDKTEEELLSQLDELSHCKANIVFVLNNVNQGVIPMDKESRRFVDMTGVIGQKLASFCDEVYEVTLGLERRLK